MTTHDELIWKYLDGACTPEEKERVEKLKKEDAAFRAALLERQRLDQELEEQPLEQPSLRFAKNVMERLPELYQRSIEPLVRPLWIKVFFGSLGALFLAYFVIVFQSLGQAAPQSQGPATRWADRFSDLFASLPPQTLSILAAVSLAYLGLVFLDRFLKRKWLKKA